MKASLKNYRQAPRKVRIVANAIRGKSVADALLLLTVMPQKAARALNKLVASAFANAQQENAGLTEGELKIATITVDKGITFVRYMPRAMGRATPINRECSHVRIVLARVESAVETPAKRATAKPKTDTAQQKTKKKVVKNTM